MFLISSLNTRVKSVKQMCLLSSVIVCLCVWVSLRSTVISHASEASFLDLGVTCSISLELVEVLRGVDKVLPGALGTKLQTALRVSGPAVMSLIPEVVWVGVMHGLHSVVALSVKPAAPLKGLRRVTSQRIVSGRVENEVSGHHHLR